MIFLIIMRTVREDSKEQPLKEDHRYYLDKLFEIGGYVLYEKVINGREKGFYGSCSDPKGKFLSELTLECITLSLADKDYMIQLSGSHGPVYRNVIERIKSLIDEQPSDSKMVEERKKSFFGLLNLANYVLSEQGIRLTGAATTHVSSIHA